MDTSASFAFSCIAVIVLRRRRLSLWNTSTAGSSSAVLRRLSHCPDVDGSPSPSCAFCLARRCNANGESVIAISLSETTATVVDWPAAVVATTACMRMNGKQLTCPMYDKNITAMEMLACTHTRNGDPPCTFGAANTLRISKCYPESQTAHGIPVVRDYRTSGCRLAPESSCA